jgi:hypothetical protein
VPCSFKERLNKFSGDWLLAKTQAFRDFDLFLKRDDSRTLICGPYWLSLVRTHEIGLGDVVEFEYEDDPLEYEDDPLESLNNVFHVTVYDNAMRVKDAIVDPGMLDDQLFVHFHCLYLTLLVPFMISI